MLAVARLMREDVGVDAPLLILYVGLPLLALWRSRSITWTVIMLVASVSLVGAAVSFATDHLFLWQRAGLQWALLAALAVPAVLAFARRPSQESPRRYQFLALIVPVAILVVFFGVMTTWWTDVPAFSTPVNFLMGHSLAEDNAKWLDFTADFAGGAPIDQLVPMGGPLQLVLTFVATAMGVISSITLGGYNEVMVAANAVIYGQFMMVVISPLALAPLVGARLRAPVVAGPSVRCARLPQSRIPWPLIWLGSAVLVMTNLMLTAYGHLTLQYTILVCSLWISTFLVWSTVSRAQLLTSLSVAIGMTVWLPMNAIAAVILGGLMAFVIVRIASPGVGPRDWLSLVVVVYTIVMIWEPLYSSIALVMGWPLPNEAAGATTPGALPDNGLGSLGGGRHAAAAAVPLIGPVIAGLTDSYLFAAGGGTEQATALQALLAAAAVSAVAVVIARQGKKQHSYVRFIPVGLLAGFAVALNGLDQWATGSAPHYGAYKFTFMVVIVLLATCLPVGLLLIDPVARRMTLARWVALGAVIFALTVDSLLVRSIAAARPTQWAPPIPFDNPRSYWWPADVNGSPEQPIVANPVACVYLPQGAKAPSAILDSQLSDPQRVYSCSRLLAGLSGEDGGAQPIVDWLRREWLTNDRAWENVHGYLAGMPGAVLDKPVILLDDGSNVIGLESMRSLLNRYPADAWSR